MNYQKHYNILIERAKNRTLTSYKEKHHITPKCLGGTDDAENIVELTGREHFIAHQLLIKMHPTNGKLSYAAMMLCVSSSTHVGRSKNQQYEWLREKYSKEVSKNQTGKGNSQFGTRWIHNMDLEKSIKISKKDPLPKDWLEGRKFDFNKKETVCSVCGIETGSFKAKFCDPHRKESRKIQNKLNGKKYKERKDKEDYNKFYDALITSTTWREACLKAGYKSPDGYSHTRMKRFAKENNLTLKPS